MIHYSSMESEINFKLTYSLDDQSFYQLPPLIEADFAGNSCKEMPQMKMETLPLKFRESVKSINDSTSDIRLIYEMKKGSSYFFVLPPTSFPRHIQIKGIVPQLEKKIIPFFQDVAFNDMGSLNDQQLRSIFRTGTFNVPSKNYSQPYVWKLTTWIMKGRENINSSFLKDLGKAYMRLRSTKDVIKNDWECKRGFRISIVHGIHLILIKLPQILNLFIGAQERVSSVNYNQALNESEKLRQIRLRNKMKNNLSLYRHLKFDQFSNQEAEQMKNQLINKIQPYISQTCGKLQLQIEKKYNQLKGQQTMLDDSDEEEQFQQARNVGNNLLQKYNIQIDITKDLSDSVQEILYVVQNMEWQQNTQQFDKELTQQILQLTELKRLIIFHDDLIQLQLQELEQSISQNFQQRHPILSKINGYQKNYIKEQKMILHKKLKQEAKMLIQKQSKESNLTDYDVLQDYYTHKQEFNNNAKRIYEQMKSLHSTPNINLKFYRALFPPYQVIQIENQYELKEIEIYTVTSNYCGWRIQLMCIIGYVYTWNVLNALYESGINGYFGLKALCLWRAFPSRYSLNRITGQVTQSHYVETVCSRLKKVNDGMKKSRRQFEDQPDTGICGKSCSRICNLIEVYIFRFLFVGIFITLMLLPFLIALNLFFCAFITLTIWIFMPFLIFIRWFGTILIFDFDSRTRQYYNYVHHSPIFLPLFLLFGQIFQGMFEIMLSLAILIIYPMMALIRVAYGCIRYIVRSVYDLTMMLFIYCFGRVPLSETCLAWKVSGPKDKHNHSLFYKIPTEQIFALLMAELEKCIYSTYQQIMTEKINQPTLLANSQLKQFFQYFSAKYDFVDNGAQKLQNQLTDQIRERNLILPTIDKHCATLVRFTKQELIDLRNECKLFVQRQINLKNIDQYVWKYFGVNQIDNLVNKLLTTIFGNEILTPIEKIENRLELQTGKEFSWKAQINRAIQGLPNLNKPGQIEVVFQSKKIEKPPLQSVSKRFVKISDVIQEAWNAQSLKQSWNSKMQKQNRQYINLSLSEL